MTFQKISGSTGYKLPLTAPPTFIRQKNNKKIGLIQKIKNIIFGTENKNYYVQEQYPALETRNISRIEKETTDEREALDLGLSIDTIDAPLNNQALIINANIRKEVLEALRRKGFSKRQANSIINKKFKNHKDKLKLQEDLKDVPSKAIINKGYYSMAVLQEDLERKLQHLVKLEYDEDKSKDAILQAFRYTRNKKEFDAFIDSIPACEYYNKGYTSNQDIENIKKNAIKKMLKLGYSKKHAESDIDKKLKLCNNKNELLELINNTPQKSIYDKGYFTIIDYDELRKSGINKYKNSLGYDDKKATEIVIKLQKNLPTRNSFRWYIDHITPDINS